jgi:deoxyinosine 3'endonuclease (endonuclease V)
VHPGRELRLVAGVDVSFFGAEAAATTKERAVATVVVLTFPALEVVHTAHQEVMLSTPYIAGFLAFREAAPLAALLRRLQTTHPQLAPQLVLVDGSGVLHPAGFGLACHLGVLTGLPTVGITKNVWQPP